MSGVPPDPDRDDPLAALVARALGGGVTEVSEEPLESVPGRERARVRYLMAGVPGTALLDRYPPERALEVTLLPFLARKTDRVPTVHARGVPHVPIALRWILREDTAALPLACDVDPRAIVDAKVLVEHAVARDEPALRALGVTRRTPVDIVEEVAIVAGENVVGEGRKAARWLAKWPEVLCHGDLRCANAPLTARGVVLEGWGRAHLGCGLLDIVRLAVDLGERGDAVLGAELPRRYGEKVGTTLTSEILRAAELVDRLARRHLRVS
ncbi:MAG: hypothetical protein EXR61_00725 [Chloroflexi bacterium]|nr:hypothetical protein [Chloroflexota bacterium]